MCADPSRKPESVTAIRCRRAAVMAGALLAGLAAACGGESTARQAAVQAVDVCALLTPPEIEQTTGQSPGEPAPTTHSEYFLECRWPSADGSEFQLVYLAYRPLRNPLTYEEWVEAYKAGLGESFSESDLEMFEQVSGIGDYALFNDAGSVLGSQILVYQNGRLLNVATSGVRGTSNREATLTLARAAWNRLP